MTDFLTTFVDCDWPDDRWAAYDPNGPWTETNGRDVAYAKHHYDVRLHSGTVIRSCWPNAGRFWDCLGDGTIYDPGEIQAVRPGEHPMDIPPSRRIRKDGATPNRKQRRAHKLGRRF